MKNSNSNKNTKETIVEVETFQVEVRKETKEKYEAIFGEKSLELKHLFECIELELSQTKEIRPHILFQIIKSFFKAIHSPDPLAFHQDIARTFLNKEIEDKNKTIMDQYVDLLARELCNTCNEIGEKLFENLQIKKEKKILDKLANDKGLGNSVFSIIEKKGEDVDKQCYKKKIFIPTFVYMKFLEDKGKAGKESKKWMEENKINDQTDFWFIRFQKEEKRFFYSGAFMGLTKVLWRDDVKKRVAFDERFPPCTVKPIFKTLSSIMRAKKDDKSTSDTINLVKGTDIVGKIEIPLVPATLHNQVFRGVGKIDTVIAHKTLRYAVSLPLEQKLKGILDFRVKEYEGGFVELGEKMGVTHKKQLAELREILYALKYLDIPNIKESRITKGRLIDVTRFRSLKTGREDGLILTVLPTLVAYGKINCSGMLLIPMATLPPPVHGVMATQYHAALYYLQMTLLEEFSDKSKEFYQHKCVKIGDADWDRLLVESNIPVKYKERIIKGWIVDGDDAPKVLECIEKNHYVLGKSYKKSSKFLMNQGKIRIKKSLKGKASAQKKKNYRKQ
jgi:hypothetical protein